MCDREPYVCGLSEDSARLAQAELGEVPTERESAVSTFRQWIVQQPHIKCHTDTEFLLRFLRTGKFSQLRAREILQGYLTMKTENPTWYNDIDMTNERITAFLKSGYCLPLGFNNKGQYCIMYRVGVLDTSNKYYKVTDIWNAAFGLVYHFLSDENIMVRGLCYFMDFTGFEMKHMTYWGLEVIKKSAKIWQGNFFGRFKAFHYYNTGPVFENLMALMQPLLNKKMKSRLFVHGNNMEAVYKELPMSILPDEYLPDDYDGPSGGSIQSIIDKTLATFADERVRQRILYESRAEWGIDLTQKIDGGPAESFRKLNVD